MSHAEKYSSRHGICHWRSTIQQFGQAVYVQAKRMRSHTCSILRLACSYKLAFFEEVGDGNVQHCVILPDDIKVDNEVTIRNRAYLSV